MCLEYLCVLQIFHPSICERVAVINYFLFFLFQTVRSGLLHMSMLWHFLTAKQWQLYIVKQQFRIVKLIDRTTITIKSTLSFEFQFLVHLCQDMGISDQYFYIFTSLYVNKCWYFGLLEFLLSFVYKSMLLHVKKKLHHALRWSENCTLQEVSQRICMQSDVEPFDALLNLSSSI